VQRIETGGCSVIGVEGSVQVRLQEQQQRPAVAKAQHRTIAKETTALHKGIVDMRFS
jgi:hypothetical protein